MSSGVEIKKEEYVMAYVPTPGMALIEKDQCRDKQGRLWMPNSVKERGSKLAGTGVIRKLCPFDVHQQDGDRELRSIYQEGMRVAFSCTTPWDAPFPPFTSLSAEDGGSALVVMHIADFIGLLKLPEHILKVDNGPAD